MYRCPKCQQKTLSILADLNSYAKKDTICSNCGAAVRRKRQLSDFLVPAYMLAAIVAGRYFQVDVGGNIAMFLALAVGLFVVQIKLTKYETR